MSHSKLNILQFQDFVLNKRNIERILTNIVEENPTINNKKAVIKKTPPKQDFLIPRFKDDLFWCYYIINKGLSSYEMIHNEGFKESMEEKIQLVDAVRTNKDLLKKHKWKRRMVEDDLVNNQYISIMTFICICAIKNKNILYIDGNKFFTIEDFDTLTNLNIITKINDSYGIFVGTPEEKQQKLATCREKCWKIDNLSKPLRAISGYKLKNLQEICKKLNINIYNEKKLPKKKSILYQHIKEQL
jgi:hypothetical protein